MWLSSCCTKAQRNGFAQGHVGHKRNRIQVSESQSNILTTDSTFFPSVLLYFHAWYRKDQVPCIIESISPILSSWLSVAKVLSRKLIKEKKWKESINVFPAICNQKVRSIQFESENRIGKQTKEASKLKMSYLHSHCVKPFRKIYLISIISSLSL